MDTKDEALKMAIEALEQYVKVVQHKFNAENWGDIEDGGKPAIKAIQACKDALKQSKQFLGMKEIPYKDWVLRFYKMPDDLWYTEGINDEWMNEMVEAIKPQPKEPQYVYLYGYGNECQIHLVDPIGMSKHHTYIGKIKLEVEE